MSAPQVDCSNPVEPCLLLVMKFNRYFVVLTQEVTTSPLPDEFALVAGDPHLTKCWKSCEAHTKDIGVVDYVPKST